MKPPGAIRATIFIMEAILIKILLVEPGKVPRPAEIDPSLKSMQRTVGRCIQAIYPFEEPAALICNEEGKLCGLHVHVNRTAFGETHAKQDNVIARILFFVENHWNELLRFNRRTAAQMAQ